MKNLREMKVDELKDIAREYTITGTWKMTKDKLIEAILANAKVNGHEDRYFDGDAEPETENITEAHEDAPESIETEGHETNQDAQENEPEINEDTPAHAAAKAQIENAYNQIVGANENSVTDGERSVEDLAEWINNDAFDEVLSEAYATEYTESSCGGKAPSCMKKVTKEFCARYLLSLFKADNYDIKVDIKPAQKGHATPKRGALLAFNGKEQNICAWGKELGISPNTLYGRIYKMGWTIEKAFTTPARAK